MLASAAMLKTYCQKTAVTMAIEKIRYAHNPVKKKSRYAQRAAQHVQQPFGTTISDSI